ncbi:MAG TPA: phosphotransferase [Candidatus Saccharimonadales bacterium]|nr:phosphotransferase [Candidatus Saccharimonadales bacterium]
MIQKQAVPDSRIIDSLVNDYKFNVDTLLLLPIGADADALVYRARLRDGSEYFVKLKRGHEHDVSVTIARLLYDSGIKQIIPPIMTVHGQPIQKVGDFTLIVYPFIEGKDGLTRPLGEDHWATLGKVLRRVHDFKLPEPIQKQVRRETYSPKWREAVRSLLLQIETDFDGDESALKLAEFMTAQRTRIHHLVDQSEHLAREMSKRSPTFVLCHSDIHGGNVLIDSSDRLYVVDWDEPIMAPKERDLMFIGGGVGNVWNKPAEEESFYGGYGQTDVDTLALAYYRHERIVEDIALYGHDLLRTTDGGEDRPEMLNQMVAMFDTNGAVDMACKTDRG